MTLVEWGALVAGELPEHLAVTLETDPDAADTRLITLAASGARWTGVLDRLRAELLDRAA